MGSPNPSWVDADFNGDGYTDIGDYILWYNNSGANLQSLDMLADLDGDWIVDFDDLDILTGNDTLANPTQADGDLDLDGDIDLDDYDLAYAQLGVALTLVS